jgi:protocatechuate 3,4-dioxygenase beta subunit
VERLVTEALERTERLRAAMPRVTEALRALAIELDLTNDELLQVLGFLGDVAREDELILLTDVLGISRLVDDQTHRDPGGTASNVLGPFYRPGAPWIDNPGSIASSSSAGPPVMIAGRVTDAATGDAIPAAVVDIWHADGAGAYSMPGSADEWDLRGRQRTDKDGRYEIATIRPLHYTIKHDGPVGRLLEALGRHPWRPAHIHLLVSADGYRPLVTQVYLADGPYLDDDAIDGVKSELVYPVLDGRLAFDVALLPASAVARSAAASVIIGE